MSSPSSLFGPELRTLQLVEVPWSVHRLEVTCSTTLRKCHLASVESVESGTFASFLYLMLATFVILCLPYFEGS